MKLSFHPLLLLIATALISLTSQADTLQGKVVGITDGDTVTVLDASNTQHKIRLIGIDAPEKEQDFGKRAKDSLATLVFEKQVLVEYRKYDRYGRKLGKILVDGLDANLEQLKAGMAWHYKKYQNDQLADDQTNYALAEVLARRKKRGLWIASTPTPPWDWRKLKKTTKH